MKSLIFFIIGFALALAVLFLWNLQYFRQRRKKRKEELQEHPERKTSATKIIIFSILATYYIAFAVGVWVVVTKDFYQLSVLLISENSKSFLVLFLLLVPCLIPPLHYCVMLEKSDSVPDSSGYAALIFSRFSAFAFQQ